MSDKKRLVSDCGKIKDDNRVTKIMQLTLLCGLSPVLSVREFMLPQVKHCPSTTFASVENGS